MLGKIFKYEFKASGRILLPIYLATLALAFLSGAFFRIPTEVMENVWILKITSRLISFLYGIFVFSGVLISLIISILRFKTNLFDKEGYLMHTLPVKTHTHITAKMIVAGIYELSGIIVAMLSGALFLSFTNFYDIVIFSNLFEDIFEVMRRYPGNSLAYIVEFVLFTAATLCFINTMFYAAIAIGHSANTRQVAKSVLAYIALYCIEQIINFNLIKVYAYVDLEKLIFDVNGLHILLIGLIVWQTLYIAIYYALTNYCMKKRLNLQ